MTYLKPYGTLHHNHICLDESQRLRLYTLKLIKEKERNIHINLLARRYKAGYIEHINRTQIAKITRLFESIGYKFKDGEMRKTQVGTSLIFDHNK